MIEKKDLKIMNSYHELPLVSTNMNLSYTNFILGTSKVIKLVISTAGPASLTLEVVIDL